MITASILTCMVGHQINRFSYLLILTWPMFNLHGILDLKGGIYSDEEKCMNPFTLVVL